MKNLERKARLIDWKQGERQEYYCLFSRSGFTEALMARAREAKGGGERVFLFKKDRLIKIRYS